MMYSKLHLGLTVVGLLFTSMNPNAVIGVPTQLLSNQKQWPTKNFTAEQKKINILSTKEDGFKDEKSLIIEQSSTDISKNIFHNMDSEVDVTPLRNNQNYYGIRLNKRDTTKNNSYNDSNYANNNFKTEKKENVGEMRASSIPFLPKGSESQSSGLPSLPGMSQISNLMPNSTSSNTPTAILGGFSIFIMPMPGLSISNIGSALQTGQQMSQMLPALPISG